MKYRWYMIDEEYCAFGTDDEAVALKAAASGEEGGWAMTVIDTENGTDLCNFDGPWAIEEATSHKDYE